MNNRIHKIDQEYSIGVVENLKEFNDLKDIWNSLSEMNESYWPWLCWEWFSLWLKYFLNSNQLLVLILYSGADVVAIAPFIVKEEKYKGLIKVRKLELIGNIHSTIRNVLFGVSDDQEKIILLQIMLQFIGKKWRNWDVLEMERIPEESSDFDNIKKSVAAGCFKHRTYTSDANWYVDKLYSGSEEYFNRQPADFRKQILSKMKRFKKVSDWHIEIKSNSDSLDRDLDIFNTLREKSWKAPESDKEFARDFCVLAHSKGWLRLGILYADDSPIAGHKWIFHKDIAYILSLVYDEDYQKYSPGSILASSMFEHAIDQEKITEVDYLTGDESYKKIWTPQRRERKGIAVFNNTVKGRLLSFLMLTVLPIVKKPPLLPKMRGKS